MSRPTEQDQHLILKQKIYAVAYEHFQSDVSKAPYLANEVSEKAVEIVKKLEGPPEKFWNKEGVWSWLVLVICMFAWLVFIVSITVSEA
jgi:hypothetical protein